MSNVDYLINDFTADITFFFIEVITQLILSGFYCFFVDHFVFIFIFVVLRIPFWPPWADHPLRIQT